MNRKGQLTLLVIAGLGILIAIALIIFIQQILVEQELQRMADDSLSEFVELTSLEQYVTSCLSNVVTEGLHLLGHQGGVLYDYQGGLTPTTNFQEGQHFLPFEKNGTVYNVSYAIQNTVLCPNSYIGPIRANLTREETSFYPVARTRLEDFARRYANPFTASFSGCNGLGERVSTMSGYLGANEFPKLCSYNGSNAFNLDEGIFSCAAHQYDTPREPYAIQRQLESFVQNQLSSCVNFSLFTEELVAFDISLQEENVHVVSTFQSPRGIITRAEFPFDITVDGSRSIARTVDFQSRTDINIKRLYNFAFETIFRSLRDPFFVISRDYSTTAGFQPILSVERVRSACANCTQVQNLADDVLIFQDESSLLQGDPFRFIVASKQRKPILDYITDGNTNFFNDIPIDILVYTNDTVRLEPFAVDPDEDTITYAFFGWKEDYDEYLNLACCDDMGGCTLENHQQCLERDYMVTNILTSSQAFRDTKRIAEFQTNESDIGFREITVVVEDEHGAKDFQIVRFLVFDLPLAVLETRNEFPDIDNRYASIEDKYILDATNSTASRLLGTTLSQFIFLDILEGFFITQLNPVHILGNDSTISTIVFDYFQRDNLVNNPTRHEIELIVGQNQSSSSMIFSQPDVAEVFVAECLPHQFNTSLGTSTDYPAGVNSNIQLSSYWQGNPPHSCCEPLDRTIQPLTGGSFRSAAELCFTTNDFSEEVFALHPATTGSFLFLDRAVLEYVNGTIGPVTQQTYEEQFGGGTFIQDVFGGLNPFNLQQPSINNVFRVTHNQYCSGERGNVCGGRLATTWFTELACDATPTSFSGASAWQFATCSGPGYESIFQQTIPFTTVHAGTNLGTSPLSLDSRDLVCIYYEGTSFEQQVLSSQQLTLHPNAAEINQGYCAPEATAQLITSANQFVEMNYGNVQQTLPTEVFTCQATCDGEGDCAYHNLDLCMCTQGDSTCQGLLASDFVTPQGEVGFLCQGTAACTENCQITPTLTSREACYCQTKSSLDPSFVSYDDFPGTSVPFFDQSQGFQATGQNPNAMCCTGQKTITAQNPLLGEATCYQGTVRSSGTRFSTVGSQLQPRMLSCDGQLHFCQGNNPTSVSSPVLSRPLNAQECGFTCQASGSWT